MTFLFQVYSQFLLNLLQRKILFSGFWKKSSKNIIQIHDAKRKDREALTRTWTRPFGISLETFPAIMKQNGAQGCFESHVTLASHMPSSYFVLEDDAVPTQDAHTNIEVVTELEQCIREDTYDIIWLGGLPVFDSFSRFKTQGVLQGKCLTTYAMYVGPKAKKIISSMQYTGIPIDVVLTKLDLRGAFVHPPLFKQANTPSDIGKTEFTRGKVFASLLELVGPWWRWAMVYQNYLIVCCLIYAVINFVL